MPSEKRSREHAVNSRDPPRSPSSKRPRRDDSPSRDWRSVYLDKNSDKKSDRDSYRSSRDHSHDREREKNSNGHYHHASNRGDHHRSGGTSYRPSDRKDSPKRPRDKSRSRERGAGRHDSRRGSPSKSAQSTKPPVNVLSFPKVAADDEKEEGEISPRSECSRQATPPPSAPPAPPPSAPEPELDLLLVEEEKPVDEAEARRARRAAILAKYQASQAIHTPQPTEPNKVGTPSLPVLSRFASGTQSVGTPPPTTPYISVPSSAAIGTPIAGVDFTLSKADNAAPIEQPENVSIADQQAGGIEGVAAADYDPSKDRMDEEARRAAKHLGEDVNMRNIVEEVEEEEEDDEIDDIFALVDENEPKLKKKKKVKVVKRVAMHAADVPIDAAADEEGYYQITLGEVLDGGKYQVFANIGKGMFSNVVRARVLDGSSETESKEVAIKIVRSQESMQKAGLKEAQILQKLQDADPEDKKHLVRLERTFEHRGHLCLVFESLSMNLREVVKKFGRDVGLNIRAVRAYAHQLFLALSLLRKCNILHADIKPDNVLVNASKSMLKLCDLGSASDITYENTSTMITPYLVSRFYRAPEIILGLPYDMAVDVWSIGCTLYELYTGRILFPGRSNREMLRLTMECKGRFNTKAMKKAKFGSDYFDDVGGFLDIVEGAAGTAEIRKIHVQKPTRDIRSRLLPKGHSLFADGAEGATSEEKMLISFVDLLEKCLILDPARRITPKEALSHPFLRS